MADEIKTEEPATPAATPSPAPAEAAAPPVEAAAPAAAESAAAPETIAPTLLEQFDAEAKEKEAAAAPPVEADAKKPGEEAPKEGAPEAPVDPKPLEPVAYEFTPGEGFTLSDERRGEAIAAFDAFRADPVKGAQGLMDLHQKAVTEAVNTVRADQVAVFNETMRGWENEVRSDPELGGSGFETAMRAVAEARDAFVTTARDPKIAAMHREQFEHFLRVTGAGSHPAFLRMLHNVGGRMIEPKEYIDGGVPKSVGRKPSGKGGGDFYEHPRGGTED